MWIVCSFYRALSILCLFYFSVKTAVRQYAYRCEELDAAGYSLVTVVKLVCVGERLTVVKAAECPSRYNCFGSENILVSLFSEMSIGRSIGPSVRRSVVESAFSRLQRSPFLLAPCKRQYVSVAGDLVQHRTFGHSYRLS